jgi:hypothetical protein
VNAGYIDFDGLILSNSCRPDSFYYSCYGIGTLKLSIDFETTSLISLSYYISISASTCEYSKEGAKIEPHYSGSGSYSI